MVLQRVFPTLKLHPPSRSGGREHRLGDPQDSPRFKAALAAFLATNGAHVAERRMIFRRYLLNTQYVDGAAAEASRRRFASL